MSGFLKRILRLFSSGNSQANSGFELPDEDLDAYGYIVEVATPINTNEATGRIRYRGTTWSAMSLNEPIMPGQLAKIIFRENIAWIVEFYDVPLEAGDKEPI